MIDDHKVKILHIMLPKTSPYIKSYDRQTKWMYFFIEDDNLEKYDTVWNKVSADIKKNLIVSLSIKTFFLKTNIKSHGNEITDFCDK